MIDNRSYSSMETEHTYVVVGLGSMGKRRVRDLKELGAGQIIGVDRREDRRTQINEQFGIETLGDFDDAMTRNPRAVIVSVPPHLHYRICRAAADAGTAYFVECLTTLTLQEIDDLIDLDRKTPNRAFPSCTPLMNPYCCSAAKAMKRLGPVYSLHASLTTWLPDQHPWEKQMGIHYEFHRDHGGGLAEPAYQLSWFCTALGQLPSRVIANAAHVSDLPPGFNDLLDMVIEFDGGAVLNFHYSMCEKHDWTVGIFTRTGCAGGTVMWNQQECRYYDYDQKRWHDCQADPGWTYEKMYLDEMKHFVDALDGKERYQNSLETERRVLATLLAAEESSRTGRRIEI
jgi:predicted dehydrogenase